MAHAYVTFRLRLATHAVRRLAASLRSSAEILLLIFTHALLGLFTLAAFPPMFAASRPPVQAVALLTAHALLMAIPMVLLRQRIVPLDVVQWLRRMPVPPATRFTANALVAAMLVAPLAFLYAVSSAIVLWQRPDWLLPLRGALGTVYSLGLSYACAVAVLQLRTAPLRPVRWLGGSDPAPPIYTARAWRPRLAYLWHRLFWKPFWHPDKLVGWQQTTLLVAGLGAALPWMQSPPGIARGVLALATSTMIILITDRGDKAVRDQLALLRPIMADWPLAGRPLALAARAFSLVPAALLLLALWAGGWRHELWSRPAGISYLVFGCVLPLLLVSMPPCHPRWRVGLVMVYILMLTAIGSELWPA